MHPNASLILLTECMNTQLLLSDTLHKRLLDCSIQVFDPIKQQMNTIMRIDPHMAKWTLGVMMAPNEQANTQNATCVQKLDTYMGEMVLC
jgi:hypothetical protein